MVIYIQVAQVTIRRINLIIIIYYVKNRLSSQMLPEDANGLPE